MFRLVYKAMLRLQCKRCFDIQLEMTLKQELYVKTTFGLQPQDGFINKPKHVFNMIF
jgi:hypothetical protein